MASTTVSHQISSIVRLPMVIGLIDTVPMICVPATAVEISAGAVVAEVDPAARIGEEIALALVLPRPTSRRILATATVVRDRVTPHLVIAQLQDLGPEDAEHLAAYVVQNQFRDVH